MLATILGLLILTTLLGEFLRNHRSDPGVDYAFEPDASGTSPTLFVLFHGMNPHKPSWDEMARTLKPNGDVLTLRYKAERWSNADPAEITARLIDIIDGIDSRRNSGKQPYERIVLVAHSMGALLARSALLRAREADRPWAGRVRRAVLLAGANRGWDISGEPPADLGALTLWGQRVGYWGANLLGLSRLLFSFERGRPFVANLRLQWMQEIRNLDIEVVQLLGDIDDVVRRDDNEDLRVIASSKFAQLLVRGTGHAEILKFHTEEQGDSKALGDYRKAKVLLAATRPFDEVRNQDESQPYSTDTEVTEVVFVLHGIRDLGRWSTEFETEIERQFPGRRRHLAIVSPRYGYLGMGPFLFKGVRQRYVRWFMDQYTETLARYPNVKPENIHFFGHSNGTYIAAEALRTYESMRIQRVVFAGSVMPTDYPWESLGDRVDRVRNYVGANDWVVALFPRLFELPLIRWIGNGIGSGGFRGFDAQRVDNVRFVSGAHSGFDNRVDEIVSFLLSDGEPRPAREDERGILGRSLACSLVAPIVWLLLAALLLYVGIRVVAAAPEPTWLALLLYLLLVFGVLKTL